LPTDTELFDRYPALPILLLLLFPIALQIPFWLLGFSSDPLWFYSGITHSAQLIPGQPYLDPNAGYTSQALGHLVAWDWMHGVIPWWNPYTGIGVPLAGELQPGAFFLPFNLLLLLQDGLLWQRISMQILAALGTYALLRELGMRRLAAFMGAALFSVNGVFAWTPGPAAVYTSAPFLPWLLWGIEQARKPAKAAVSILAVGLAIAWMILAGFPEPAYISGLLALAWGLYRMRSAPRRWEMARRTLGGFALGLMVAAPLLIAFVDYLLQSDSFAAHDKSGLSKAWAGLPAMVLPYVYGPLGFPLAISNPLVEKAASTGGYTGILILLMATVGLVRKSADRGLKVLLLVWVLLCWARNFGVQPITAVINHVPLLNRAMFFRYAGASWILALTILAAYGLEEIRDNLPGRRSFFIAALSLLLLCTFLAWPQRAYWGWADSQQKLMFVFLGAVLLWTVAGLVAVALAWKRPAVLATILIFDAAVMFLGAQLTGKHDNYLDLPAMQFLRDHQGLSRNYSLGPLTPNYSAYFNVPSLNHNILPVPKLWNQYVDRYLLPGFQMDSGVTFYWPVWGDTSQAGPRAFFSNLDKFRDLSTRYVITPEPVAPQPPSPLSRLLKRSPAAQPSVASQPQYGEAMTQHGLHKVYADSLLDIWEIPAPAPYYEVMAGGPCVLTAMEREAVTATCSSPARLRRRELYMPGWQAKPSKGNVQPVQQDGIFQTTALPQGASDVRFSFTPPHVQPGWILCLFGTAGLLWQAVRIGLRREDD
jgi:hypothetical protein